MSIPKLGLELGLGLGLEVVVACLKELTYRCSERMSSEQELNSTKGK